MRRIIFGLSLLAALLASAPAPAQNTTGLTVATCGSPPTAFTATRPGPFTVDTGGQLCITGSISASLSGFAPATQGTPVAATTGGNTQTLPVGAVVVATNVGTTNAAYCRLGAAATTDSQYIAPNGGWFAFTVGANTQITCVTSTSTTTVNTAGGAGLPTGTGGGGGSGGGGGGAITAASGSYASGALSSGSVASGAFASGSVASGAYASGSIASGAMVDLGAIADAAATAGSTGSVSAKLRLMTTQLSTASTAAKQPALGTAGAASADVLSVQGIASMTPLLANPGTAANWGVGTSTQNSASVANGQLALAQFNTTPTTITTGNMSPLQMDSAGNLLVNIKAGAGSGGTALADGATFTEATTSFTPVGGEYVSGGGANCTTGKGCTLQMTIDRMAYVNLGKVSGTALGTPAAYGSTPTGNALSANVFVSNSNPNGSAVSASSSPVVVASDQLAIAVKNNGGSYETVAASQTAQAMGATGATGDYLSHCVIYPATTSPGVVTVFDNTNAAATNVIAFAGGATSTSNLTPISVPVGAVSTAGAWKVTTGANVSAVCYGKFT